MKGERGFTLLVVLLVAIVLAVVGSSAVLIGTRETGTAGARSLRAQALAAAEAGLAHYQQIAHPSMTVAGEYYIGGAGTADADWRWLPQVPGRSGGTLEPRYRVRGVGPGPTPETGLAVIEGQVVSGGRVIATAELSVIVKAEGGIGDAGTHQEDYSEAGGSADGVASNSSINLQGGDFDG